jgi:hypothetical protein
LQSLQLEPSLQPTRIHQVVPYSILVPHMSSMTECTDLCGIVQISVPVRYFPMHTKIYLLSRVECSLTMKHSKTSEYSSVEWSGTKTHKDNSIVSLSR